MQKILKEKTLLFGFLILPVLTLFVTVGISLLQPRTGTEFFLCHVFLRDRYGEDEYRIGR